MEHLEGVFSKRNSPNKLKVSMPLGAKPWLADVNDLLYKAGRRAIKTGVFLFIFFFSSWCVCKCAGSLCSTIGQNRLHNVVLQPLTLINLIDFDRTTHQHLPYFAKFLICFIGVAKRPHLLIFVLIRNQSFIEQN